MNHGADGEIDSVGQGVEVGTDMEGGLAEERAKEILKKVEMGVMFDAFEVSGLGKLVGDLVGYVFCVDEHSHTDTGQNNLRVLNFGNGVLN